MVIPIILISRQEGAERAKKIGASFVADAAARDLEHKFITAFRAAVTLLAHVRPAGDQQELLLSRQVRMCSFRSNPFLK